MINKRSIQISPFHAPVFYNYGVNRKVWRMGGNIGDHNLYRPAPAGIEFYHNVVQICDFIWGESIGLK